MTETIKILDHGYIKLIGSMGTDETVIEAARMSTGKGFEGWEPHVRCKVCHMLLQEDGTQPKWSCEGGVLEHQPEQKKGDASLLEFLYANRHMTPFEMGELCIEVQAPIFVFREWHRHRTQSYNEFSARYEVMPNLHYVPELERIQRQSQINKQGSGEPFPEEFANDALQRLANEQELVYTSYEEMVNLGVAKEVARVNTPVSRYSKMRAKTDVRNWLAFLSLRCENNAQWEIRQYANALAQIIKSIWPRTFELWLEHDFLSVRFSRTDMRVIHTTLEMLHNLDERSLGEHGAHTLGPMMSILEEAAKKNGLDEKKTKAFTTKIIRNREFDYPHFSGKSRD